MNKDLIAVFEYLEKEKGINREVIIKAIEESLCIAARKNISGASNVTVKINSKSGDIDVLCEKEIVNEVEVPAQEISLEEARKFDPDCEIGQYIDVIVTPRDFGRIAAQKARQVITRKLKNAERDVIYEEYRHRIHDIVSGTVKKFVRGANAIVDLGKVEALMPMREYPKTEKYHIGDKVTALLKEVVDNDQGGADVILSRSATDFVEQLMAQEVPEISDNIIEIVQIVREPGYRTKLVVKTNDDKLDPVGACVGVRGMRIKNVVRELNNEKIDIVPFAASPVDLLENALAPIEIRKISINEEDKVISLVVEDDDYGAVIGKKGMNARLCGQLIGHELEVQKMSEYRMTVAIQRTELAESEDPTLDEPLNEIPGINSFIFDQLAAEGYNTARKLLLVSVEELARIPGISLELAERIIEQIRKQRI